MSIIPILKLQKSKTNKRSLMKKDNENINDNINLSN